MTSEIPVKPDNENPRTEVEEGNSSGKETSGETPDELEMSQFTEIQLSAESANYSTENFLESSNDTHHNNSIIQPETQSEASFSTERRTWLLCFICLELASGEKLSCCKNFVCYMCFKLHVETQISGGIFDVSCPFCDKSVKHTDLFDCLDDKTKKVLARLLLIANLKKNEKLCPRCDFLEKVTPNKIKPQSSEASLDVVCSQCGLNWCFYCHSPSHKGKNCKEYQRPDNTFSEWRATLDTDWNPNAQKCPKCQINIQRDGGCTHMKCTRCKTDFCYKCGRAFKGGVVYRMLVGDHYDKYSIVGCPTLLYPESRIKRNADLLDCLDDKTKKVLARLLLIANLKKNEKLCPRCDFLEKVTPNKTKPQSSEASLDVICSQCGLNWCFYCHSPSHKGKNCKEYQRPDNTFSEWRATLDTDWNPNAQKCPKCQINIQRDGGCTHMKCTRCKTDFCYKCGRAFKGGVVYRMLVGDHYDKYSIVGCPTLLYPESRVKRNAVRIMVYSAKKLVLLPCFIVVGVLVLAVLPFLVISFLPILLFMSSAKICCKAQTQEQIVPA